MNDKELEKKIYDYFDTEVPQPNPEILNNLKRKMHEKSTPSTKRFSNKFRLALVSCMIIVLIIPAVTLPFVWDNLFPSDTPAEEEIYYSDSTLTMSDLSTEELNTLLTGDLSVYYTLLENYTIDLARGYYGDNDVLVYISLEATKNTIPFTQIELNLVFEENYEHEYDMCFKDIVEFKQYDDCKLYEYSKTSGYLTEYYKLIAFDDYKVYLYMDKQDMSIVDTIIQG